MAAKKAPAPAKKVSTKQATKPKPKGLSAATVALLMGLSARYDKRPDQPVRDGDQESKALSLTMTKLGHKLVTHGGLAKGAEKDLIKRREWLETSEHTWIGLRDFSVKGSIVSLRKQGTELKQIVIPALRHFMRDDREMQVRLDTIVAGSGDLDLSDDLIKLADLTENNMAALKTPEVSKSMPALMREVAAKISAAITERTSNVESSQAIQLRNRAYWYLYDLVTEIQSAGRFVYRNDPAALKHFRVLRRNK